MTVIKRLLKNETVLCAAALLAVASMFLVPPDKAYLGYVDLSVLAILFCLMAVIAGLRKAGLFDWMSSQLAARVTDSRALTALLTGLCFFTSAFITNDVALITFVPFTIQLMRGEGQKKLIFTIVAETVAANLGSLITPIGNPQNLYLYTFFKMDIGEFFAATLPLGGISLLLVAGLLLFAKGGKLSAREETQCRRPEARRLALYAALFIVCILTVLRILPYSVCFAVVFAALLLFDRRLFAEVDYILLVTFVCFFVFVGNAARIDAVRTLIGRYLAGREILVGALLSQVISNVPAATMLASFTENAKPLLIGVNVGGLGTMIASMASLISYRLYTCAAGAERGRYFKVFTAVNVILLALLLTASLFLFG